MHHDYENGNTQDHVDYHKNILEYIYFFVFFSTSAAHFPENNYNHRLVSSEPSYVLFFSLDKNREVSCFSLNALEVVTSNFSYNNNEEAATTIDLFYSIRNTLQSCFIKKNV